jgi:hypothetical protein
VLTFPRVTETLSIKVPKGHKARLKALASKRKTSLTALMLQALEALAKESERVSPASCYELTRDLFETPGKLGASKEGDRSINKARMNSFGKRGSHNLEADGKIS